MGQRADRFISDNAGVIKNLLKFADGRVALFFSQINLAPKINGIERKGEVLVRVSKVIRCSRGQGIEGGLRVSAVESESRSSHRQISSLNDVVLRKTLRQVVDSAIGVRDIARECKSDGGK